MITSETKLSISWPVKTYGVFFMYRTILISFIKSDSLSTAKISTVRSKRAEIKIQVRHGDIADEFVYICLAFWIPISGYLPSTGNTLPFSR